MRVSASALLASPVIAFVVSAAVLGFLLRSGIARRALDRPNSRSLHTLPTPRIGGLGVIAGAAAAWWTLGTTLPVPLWLALAAVALVSFYDDLRGARVGVRLLVHLVAAAATAWTLLGAGADWMLVCAAALSMLWMTNLYNFMDGADGLAGGMGLLGFGAYAAGATLSGDFEFAAWNAALAAAAGGFLVFNFPPARVFMGDTGAITLGFTAGAFGMLGALRGDWPWWFGVLVFAPFIVDASVTLARRAARGERIWNAHRQHYYQRLVRSGWNHRRTALAEYVLMAASGALALLAVAKPAWQGWVVGLAALLALGLIARLETRLPGAAE